MNDTGPEAYPVAMNDALPYFDSLLPPLWGVAASYLDYAERWFYFGVFPCLPPPPLTDPLDYVGHRAVLQCVITHDHTHMLHRLGHMGHLCQMENMCTAVRLDRLEIMKWFRTTFPSEIIRFYRLLAYTSASAGAVNVLMWENETKLFTWTVSTCDLLAAHNHFAALRQLRGCSAPWDNTTYVSAVKSGNVEMVQWLVAEDSSFCNPYTATMAIGTRPMLAHCIGQFITSYDLKQFVSHFICYCSIDMFGFVLGERVLERCCGGHPIVGWVAKMTRGVDKIKLAIAHGYPLPPPDYEAGGDVYVRLLEVGWMPA